MRGGCFRIPAACFSNCCDDNFFGQGCGFGKFGRGCNKCGGRGCRECCKEKCCISKCCLPICIPECPPEPCVQNNSPECCGITQLLATLNFINNGSTITGTTANAFITQAQQYICCRVQAECNQNLEDVTQLTVILTFIPTNLQPTEVATLDPQIHVEINNFFSLFANNSGCATVIPELQTIPKPCFPKPCCCPPPCPPKPCCPPTPCVTVCSCKSSLQHHQGDNRGHKGGCGCGRCGHQKNKCFDNCGCFQRKRDNCGCCRKKQSCGCCPKPACGKCC